jgi:hypothetical protein
MSIELRTIPVGGERLFHLKPGEWERVRLVLYRLARAGFRFILYQDENAGELLVRRAPDVVAPAEPI